MEAYNYKGLIRGDTTNEDLVSSLMNHSNAGMIIQLFVLQAIEKYANEVLDNEEEVRKKMGERNFIDAETWLLAAKDTVAALEARRGGQLTPQTT